MKGDEKKGETLTKRNILVIWVVTTLFVFVVGYFKTPPTTDLIADAFLIYLHGAVYVGTLGITFVMPLVFLYLYIMKTKLGEDYEP